MNTTTPTITLEEQEKILALAANYIREPAHWTTGTWKCDIIEVDKKGLPILAEDGMPKKAMNPNGRPLHQYCIEGAVNQATIDVVGEERALALGAVSRDSKTGQLEYNENLPEFGPTTLMGLDAIAFELYAAEMEWYDEHEARALEYNDGKVDHEGVLEILRTGLRRVRASLGS